MKYILLLFNFYVLLSINCLFGQLLESHQTYIQPKPYNENYEYALSIMKEYPSTAVKILKKHLQIFYEKKDDKKIINCLYNIAGCYTEMDQNDSASIYTFKGRDLSESINYAEGVAKGQLRLANSYMGLGDYKKAVEYYLSIEKYFKGRKDSSKLTSIHLNLCGCYGELGQYEKGLKHCESAENYIPKKIQTYSRSKDKAYQKIRAYLNKANIFSKRGDSLLVIDALQKAYKLAKKEDATSFLTEICENLGRKYFEYSQYKLAEIYLLEGLEFSKLKDNSAYMADIYRILSYVYESENEYKKSLQCIKKYNVLIDNANLVSQIENINKLELKYKMEKNRLELDIKDTNIQSKNKLLLIIILSSLLGLCILYIIVQKTKKALVSEIEIKIKLLNQINKIENLLKKKSIEMTSLELTLIEKANQIEIVNAHLSEKNKEIKLVNKLLNEKHREVTSVSLLLEEKNTEVNKISIILNAEIKNKEYILDQKKETDILLNKKIEELNNTEILLREKNDAMEKASKLLKSKNEEIESAAKLLNEKNYELIEVSQLLADKVHEINIIERSLDKKNDELVGYAVLLAQKNEIIHNSIEKINKLNSETPSNVSTNLKGIVSNLKYSNNETAWREFEQKFIEKHHDFYEKLASNFPLLTPNEIRMCALLKLNMSTKEIASITLQTIRAVEVARHRIRKKMNLPKEGKLINFLKINT